jgi:predicted P-loop ATPase
MSMAKRDSFADKKVWVNWKIVLRGDKKTKVPFQPNGKPADATDSDTWHTYAECKAYDEKVGFVLSDELSMVVIDLDKCLDPETGIIADSAYRMVYEKADTYTEISPSGTGVHIIFKVPTPFVPLANRSSKAPHFEIYSKARYMTYTGNPYQTKKKIRTLTHEELTSLLEIVGYPWGNNPHIPVDIPTSTIPDASTEILARMFASKNGDKIKALYDGDISAYKDDASAADAALLMHLAYWTQKNPNEMRSLWLASPLGQREKTHKRPDYQDRSIKNAIQKCKDTYTPPAAADPELDLIYTITKEGARVYPLISENIMRLIANHDDFSGRFRFDEFKNMYEVKDTSESATGGRWREMKDGDAMVIQSQIVSNFPPFIKVKKDMVFDAIIAVANANKYDSAKDFIRSLQWDGINRLDSWLTHTYGVADTQYHQAVGSNWFKGMVKRIMQPGCKFDHVLVLEGPQGTKKSTSLAIIGRDWHVETTMSTDTKDFFQQFQGKAIIEFSEGEILGRTETKRLKAIITMQYDRFRPAYGRLPIDFPRRCVFAMTTNQEEYLKDESGNRRWLPVSCVSTADVEWLEQNRDQLFAEAYARIEKGESIWEFPEDETRAMQESRRITDPNTDAVVDWYMTQTDDKIRNDGITVQQTYNGAILKQMTSYKPLAKWEEQSIATILKDVLKLKQQRNKRNGSRQVRYYPSDDTKAMLDETPRTEHIPSVLLKDF